MSVFHQKEVLKLFYDNKCSCLSENKNGTFINMSKLSKNVIEKLEKYIEYYEDQQKELYNQEKKCTLLEQNFFKDNLIPSSTEDSFKPISLQRKNIIFLSVLLVINIIL